MIFNGVMSNQSQSAHFLLNLPHNLVTQNRFEEIDFLNNYCNNLKNVLYKYKYQYLYKFLFNVISFNYFLIVIKFHEFHYILVL